MDRFFQSGVGLTKAKTGLPETNSTRPRVTGLAPAGSASRVTTPLRLDELEELVVEVVVEVEPPAAAPPEPPEGWAPPDCGR